MKTAVGYMRTSSATNVGNDKDSKKRQLAAIQDYANTNQIQVVATFYDAAVKGTDDILDRKQFAEMLQYCSLNGITTIIVEDISRLARDLMVQLTAESYLKKNGIQLIPTTSPDYFLRNDPTSTLIRNVLSSLAAFEKSNLCTKLAVARARKKALTGRCEGRKPISILAPDAVAYARKLANVRKRKPSLMKIAMALADAGYVNTNGNVYTAKTVQAMLSK